MTDDTDVPSDARTVWRVVPPRRSRGASRPAGTTVDSARAALPPAGDSGLNGTAALRPDDTVRTQPDSWSACAAACRTAAFDYAQHCLANWARSASIGTQREAQWFEDANRAFAAWYAWYVWWQAAFGIPPPGAAPFAGAWSGWWWAWQDALPFAGVV